MRFNPLQVFFCLSRNPRVYVPKGSLEAYKAADQWKDFFFVEEGDPTSIIGTIADKDEQKPVKRYTASGRQLNAPEKGLNIVRYSDGTVRKMIVR